MPPGYNPLSGSRSGNSTMRSTLIGLLTASLVHCATATARAQPQGDPRLPAGAVARFGAMPFNNGSRILASALAPDGKRLATLGHRSASVWDTATGEVLFRHFFDIPPIPTPYGNLAFSPDGKWLACRPD